MTLRTLLLFPLLLLGPTAWSSTALWSEFHAYEGVESFLPQLKMHRIDLHLAVRDGEWDTPAFQSLWRAATARGIGLRAWFLLSREDGYWPNKWNHVRYAERLEAFLDVMRSRGLPTPWVSFDLEPPPALMEEVAKRAAAFDLSGLFRVLGDSSRSGSYREALQGFGALVTRLHARGIRTHAVTLPFVLHDLRDEQHRIQSALGVPLQGIDWDEVSFMVYRPEFKKLAGKVGPDLVYRYARDISRHFGSRGAIDLGEVGQVSFPMPVDGYTDPEELRKDAAAARAALVTRIHVYSLDGITQFKDAGFWFEAAEAAPKRPQRELKAGLIRKALDAGKLFLPKPWARP